MFQKALLTDSDVEALAPAVCTVLEKVGLMCRSEDLLGALASWGATVDRASQRAIFPRKLVEAFVEAIRRESPAEDAGRGAAFRPPGMPGLGTQVAQFFYDDATGRRRSGNRRDLVTLTKLGEALHGEHGVGHSLLLTDVPPMLEPLEAGLILAEHARRPGPPFAWHVSQADYLIEMGEILGIPNWFTWGAICLAHPLRFDGDSAEKFVRRVRDGGGASLCSMPVAGVSTPVTPAGFIAVSAAEFLALWMAGRSLSPRAALGGGLWPGTVDMRTGEVSFCCFDALFYGFATVEFLRRWTGVRMSVGGGEYCDAKAPGLYAAYEKAYKAMTIAAFCGGHPGIGQGMLEEGKTLSPVQLLLERDLTSGVRLYGAAVEATADALALEEICDVGFGVGRNHLDTDHTARHFRRCLWLPEFIDRSGWAGFEHEARMLARCRARCDDLLAAYRKPDVDPGRLAKMREVVERARRKLG